MKPFNLEAVLRGEPVITRDGREVTDLKHFPNAKGDYCLVGLLDGVLMTWRSNGRYYVNDEDSGIDLFMKPTARKLTWYVADAEGYYLYTSASDRVNNLKKILSATVNEDGSVTVEVED